MNVLKKNNFQGFKTDPALCALDWFEVEVGRRHQSGSSSGGIADKDGGRQTINNNAASSPRETARLAKYENKLSRCFRWFDQYQNGW